MTCQQLKLPTVWRSRSTSATARSRWPSTQSMQHSLGVGFQVVTEAQALETSLALATPATASKQAANVRISTVKRRISFRGIEQSPKRTFSTARKGRMGDVAE